MAQTIDDLDRRVTALETAQGHTTDTLKWVVAKLGRIQAVQDEHTQRLERVETRLEGVETRLERVVTRLERVEARLDSVESKVDALPRAIAELFAASEKRLMAAIANR